MATRVLIVDDHVEVRRSIKGILDRADGFTVVDEAENGTQAIEEAARLLPDVVIMDVFMPVMGGLEATRAIARDLPQVRVVALTADPTMVYEALAAGAAGCLLKGDSAASITAALRGACDLSEVPIDVP